MNTPFDPENDPRHNPAERSHEQIAAEGNARASEPRPVIITAYLEAQVRDALRRNDMETASRKKYYSILTTVGLKALANLRYRMYFDPNPVSATSNTGPFKDPVAEDLGGDPDEVPRRHDEERSSAEYERQVPEWVTAADEQERLYLSVEIEAGIKKRSEKRAADDGAPQMVMDWEQSRDQDFDIEREVSRYMWLKKPTKVGEEDDPSTWKEIVYVVEGDYVFDKDPIDGSTLAQTTGQNFAIIYVIFRETNGVLLPVGTVIIDGTSRVMVTDIVDGENLLCMEDNMIDLANTGRVPLAASPFAVAGVLASDKARRVAAPLFRTRVSKNIPGGGWGLEPRKDGDDVITDPGFTVITVGGTPIAMHMATGGLRYFLVPSWQTPHDAAGLIPLAKQGDRFGFLRLDEPIEMTGAQYLETFRLHRPNKGSGAKQKGEGTPRCIPPVLVYLKPDVPTVGPGARPGERVVDRMIAALRRSFNATYPDEIYPPGR